MLKLKTPRRPLLPQGGRFARQIMEKHAQQTQPFSADSVLTYLLPAQLPREDSEDLFACLEMLARLLCQPGQVSAFSISNIFHQVRCQFAVHTIWNAGAYGALSQAFDRLQETWRTPEQALAAGRVLTEVQELRSGRPTDAQPEKPRSAVIWPDHRMAMQSLNTQLYLLLRRCPPAVRQEQETFFQMLTENAYRLHQLERVRTFWRKGLSALGPEGAQVFWEQLSREPFFHDDPEPAEETVQDRLIRWLSRAGEQDLHRLYLWVTEQKKRAEKAQRQVEKADMSPFGMGAYLEELERSGSLPPRTAEALRRDLGQTLRAEEACAQLWETLTQLEIGQVLMPETVEGLQTELQQILQLEGGRVRLWETLRQWETEGTLSAETAETLRHELRRIEKSVEAHGSFSKLLSQLETEHTLSSETADSLRRELQRMEESTEAHRTIRETLSQLERERTLSSERAESLRRELRRMEESAEARRTLWETLSRLERDHTLSSERVETLRRGFRQTDEASKAYQNLFETLTRLKMERTLSVTDIHTFRERLDTLREAGRIELRLLRLATGLPEDWETAQPGQELRENLQLVRQPQTQSEPDGSDPAEGLAATVREFLWTGAAGTRRAFGLVLQLRDQLAALEAADTLSAGAVEKLERQLRSLVRVQQLRSSLRVELIRLPDNEGLTEPVRTALILQASQPQLGGGDLPELDLQLAQLEKAGALPADAAAEIRSRAEQVHQAEQAVRAFRPEGSSDWKQILHTFAERYAAQPEQVRQAWLERALAQDTFAADFLGDLAADALGRNGAQTLALAERLREPEPMIARWLELVARGEPSGMQAFFENQEAEWKQVFLRWSQMPELRAWQEQALPLVEAGVWEQPDQSTMDTLCRQVFRTLLERDVQAGWTDTRTLVHWLEQGLVLEGIRTNTVADTFRTLVRQQHRLGHETILPVLRAIYGSAPASKTELRAWLRQADAPLLHSISAYLVSQAEEAGSGSTPGEIRLAEELEQILYTAPQTTSLEEHQLWQSRQLQDRLDRFLERTDHVPGALIQLMTAGQEQSVRGPFQTYLSQTDHWEPAQVGHLLSAFPELSGQLGLAPGVLRPEPDTGRPEPPVLQLPPSAAWELYQTLQLARPGGMPAPSVPEEPDGVGQPTWEGPGWEPVLAAGGPSGLPPLQAPPMEYRYAESARPAESASGQEERLAKFQQQMTLYEQQLRSVQQAQEKLLGEVLRKADRARMEQSVYDRIDEEIRLAARRYGFS